jgi:hypothetical protein
VRPRRRSGTLTGMDEIPTPKDLRSAARACTFLAYAAGLAGVAAGTLVLRDGELAFAVILWTITFAVGAALMGVSVLVRAVSGLTVQITRMESDLRVLRTDRARGPDVGLPPVTDHDPWLGH